MKRLISSFTTILFLAFSIQLSAFNLLTDSAFAEEKPASLEEIVVTATKIEEPKKDVPTSVQIITQQDIKNSTPKDAGDLISEASIGHVHKYPGALTGRIELRGLTTKEGKEGFHGSIGSEIGSWDYWKMQAELSGKKGAFDFYLTSSRSSSGDFEAKDYGKIENTGYNDEAVSARLGYRLFDKHHISVGFQHWRGWEIGSPGARYSPDPDNYSDKGRDSFDVGYKTEDFNAKYYLIKDRDEWHGGMISGIGNSNITPTKTDTQGASLQKMFPIGDHRVIVGRQWDRIEVDSSRNTGAPYNPNLRYDSYGVFTEGRLSLFNKKLLLSAGLRYDYFKNGILSTPGITSLKPREEDLDYVTARGGIVYKLTDSMSLKGNIGTAFRTPAPDELATDYVSVWGTRYIGNPNLKPEKSTSYDAGIEYSKDLFNGG